MLAASTGLVVKENDRRPVVEVIVAVGPKVGLVGFLLAWLELLDGGFISVEDGFSEESLF